jgi:hypothetical protein
MRSSLTGAGLRAVLPMMIAASATAAVSVKTSIPVFRMIVLSETVFLSDIKSINRDANSSFGDYTQKTAFFREFRGGLGKKGGEYQPRE